MFLIEHEPDVILGTESWLSTDISDAEIFPQNYVTYRKDRSGKSGGGVFISVREDLISFKEDWNSVGTCEAVWCRVIGKCQKHYIFGCFYDPPSDCILSPSEFLAVLEVKAQLHNSKILVGGDFNLPDIDWDNMMTCAGGRYRSKGDLLLGVLNNCGLEQMVRTPTRISENASNILDLVITNVPQLVNNLTACIGISDHLAITLQLENIWRRPKVKRKVKFYSRANFELINSQLYEYYLEFYETAASRTVNENWIQFKDSLKSVEELVPSRTVHANSDPPWYNSQLKRLDNKQRKLHQRAKQYGCDFLLQRYKDIRKSAKQAHRDAEMRYKNKLGVLLKENSKYFWKYIKTKRGKKSGISALVSDDGEVVHDALDIANILNNQYKKVFSDASRSVTSLETRRTTEIMQPVNIDYLGI